jgi:putative Holliday junction resolvase
MTGTPPGRGRVVGVDLGTRRIGLAVCDGARTLATPLTTLERSGDDAADRAALCAVVAEVGATTVVVGLPLSMSGDRGPAARAAEQETAELARLLAPAGVGVETVDERLSTVTATKELARAGARGRKARARVDRSAATVLLQAWLDRR